MCLALLIVSSFLAKPDIPHHPVFSVCRARPGMLEGEVRALLGPPTAAGANLPPAMPEGAFEVFKPDENVHWARFRGGVVAIFGTRNNALLMIGPSLERDGDPVANASSSRGQVEAVLGPSDWGGSADADYFIYGEVMVGYRTQRNCFFILTDWKEYAASLERRSRKEAE